jgi:hypothetical protein
MRLVRRTVSWATLGQAAPPTGLLHLRLEKAEPGLTHSSNRRAEAMTSKARGSADRESASLVVKRLDLSPL